jgi:hypothetical protein
MEGTAVNITSVNSEGKEIKKSVNYINPNASNGAVSSFIVSLAGLSNDTLTGIEKVTKTNLEIPQNENQG